MPPAFFERVLWMAERYPASTITAVSNSHVQQHIQARAAPCQRGRRDDRGLWRYTRHPNYFGDFLAWWGLCLVAVSDLAGLRALGWTAVGPAIMSFLLMRASGVPLLERSLRQRRPGYEPYIRRTSASFPWPPRAG